MRAIGLALALAAGALGCSDGTDGAVSFRWRIVDLSTGQSFDPRIHFGPNGSCECLPGACQGTSSFHIDRVKLSIVEPLSGVTPAVDPALLLFNCSLREATTPFKIPAGRYALSLQTFELDGSPTHAVTPAPAVRSILNAEIVNLDVVEIGVDQLPAGP